MVKFDGSGSKMHEIHWFLAIFWVPEAVGAQKKKFKRNFFRLVPHKFLLGVEGDPPGPPPAMYRQCRDKGGGSPLLCPGIAGTLQGGSGGGGAGLPGNSGISFLVGDAFS